MSSILHLLHSGPAEAATNMALDATLCALGSTAVLRFYSWSRVAFTFGYSQRIGEVRPRLEAVATGPAEMIRRPTGGGLVDHRHDLTYALGLSPSHPSFRSRPLEFYRDLHAALGRALGGFDLATELASPASASPTRRDGMPLACFDQPAPFDLIEPAGQKIAGAALHRSSRQLLAQGSLDRRRLPPGVAVAALQHAIAEAVAEWLGHPHRALAITLAETPPPSRSLIARFASDQWNHRR